MSELVLGKKPRKALLEWSSVSTPTVTVDGYVAAVTAVDEMVVIVIPFIRDDTARVRAANFHGKSLELK